MTIWVVRAGRNGEYEDAALNCQITTIDWNELGDLSYIHNREDLKVLYDKAYPDHGKANRDVSVGQIWAFIKKMHINDIVIMPLKRRSSIAIGRVTGEYKYNTNVPVESYQTRTVKWENMFLPRDILSKEVQNTLCCHLTVFQVKNDEESVIRLMKGTDN